MHGIGMVYMLQVATTQAVAITMKRRHAVYGRYTVLQSALTLGS